MLFVFDCASAWRPSERYLESKRKRVEHISWPTSRHKSEKIDGDASCAPQRRKSCRRTRPCRWRWFQRTSNRPPVTHGLGSADICHRRLDMQRREDDPCMVSSAFVRWRNGARLSDFSVKVASRRFSISSVRIPDHERVHEDCHSIIHSSIDGAISTSPFGTRYDIVRVHGLDRGSMGPDGGALLARAQFLVLERYNGGAVQLP